ncbi:MAG: NADH:flavin oxidoreductase [Pirellulaceae bacterium]
MSYPRINNLKTAEAFRQRLAELEIDLPLDEVVESSAEAPLAAELHWKGGTIGNRFAILPMEGWDGTSDGRPSDLTRRRWKHFGLSGAKLIWGGEAVAVRHDGRANPNQLVINDANLAELEALRDLLVRTHEQRFQKTNDLCVGLQLTHSGRFARPNTKSRLEPRTVYRHPVLDKKFLVDADEAILSDDDLDRLVEVFVQAAKLSYKAGYAFVDVKHCHGYLGHELLSGYDRAGKYGGDFENRTRFLRNIVDGIRTEAPGLHIGTRISIFDFVPFQAGSDGKGEPVASSHYSHAFGGDGTGIGVDLTEPLRLMALLEELNVHLVCTTAGSPYYCPHIQRPAIFPPSDGYNPPEDPLVGVARQVHATAKLKQMHPGLLFVGSGYTYLQDWLPNVGQAVIRQSMADSIGLGRMVLSYPEMPADVLAGAPLARKKICRTFSECTTGPRNGMISGCFPLDPFYKELPERKQIMELKKLAKDRST